MSEKLRKRRKYLVKGTVAQIKKQGKILEQKVGEQTTILKEAVKKVKEERKNDRKKEGI